MSGERVERRLAAILAADVVGYSRLMGEDEAGTLNRLRSHRRELIDPKIAEHKGRIVKTTGDGILIEFPSVVEAVACAVAVQRSVTERNVSVPEDQRIVFRVGVNLGDIIIAEDNDIHGDGVNVAARLEGVAEPGGICVSGTVRDHIGDRLDLVFEDLGDQSLKNIVRPIRVYRVRLGGVGVGTATAALAGSPSLPLPDKPSIAVLPFQNMSGDPEQEYFADGMVEEITTAIARLPWLFVIARNSSFAYKGKSPDLRQVGRELGVRYVLEGSVRKGGNRVRITGQLIDATTGTHIWADRFDGPIDDVFELQDQVASSVIGAIEPKLRHAEIERATRKPTNSLDAYDLYLRALAELHKWSAESFQETVRLLRDALSIDPSYAPAAALFAFCRGWQNAYGWEWLSTDEVAEALSFARRAVDTAKDDPDALWIAGQALGYFAGDHAAALALIDRSLALNGNSALAWCARGYVLTFANKGEQALESFSRAIRLSPFDPLGSMFKTGMAGAYMVAGKFEEAMTWIDKSLQEHPENAHALRWKAALCGHLGRTEEGRKCVRDLISLYPGATVKRFEQNSSLGLASALRSILLDGLRKAGLPEE